MSVKMYIELYKQTLAELKRKHKKEEECECEHAKAKVKMYLLACVCLYIVGNKTNEHLVLTHSVENLQVVNFYLSTKYVV